jgi:hypothetical protein
LGKKEEMLADLAKAFEIYPSEAQAIRKEMIEGGGIYARPLGDGSDFDAYQKDPDFRRLIFPEEFEGEEKA